MMFPEETFQVFKTGQEKVRLFFPEAFDVRLRGPSCGENADRDRAACVHVCGGVSNIDGFCGDGIQTGQSPFDAVRFYASLALSRRLPVTMASRMPRLRRVLSNSAVPGKGAGARSACSLR